MMKQVTIFTDGACSGNPGIGGWAAVLLYNDFRKEISGAEAQTTNNRMELSAAIFSLKLLKEPCEVSLYSDSAYLINAFNEHWIFGWKKKNWQRDGKDILNKDLWCELYQLNGIHKINWIKVKGHADNENNNRCDELAREAVKTIKNTKSQENS